ncbi:MAG: hypothetical protein QNK05_17195 [Myxococcota bacterium]|nr:hypothetical protein [Myxococcota bacterium]
MRTLRMLLLSSALCSLALLLSSAAGGVDGRIELNQATIDAAGGFPFMINQPGSYVLTGDLSVGAGSNSGIRIQAADVTLDLNGFSLRGPDSCSPGSCSGGARFGIIAAGSQVVHTVVRNGNVSGFSGVCVFVFEASHVTDLSVSSCGLAGISAGAGSLVESNRVEDVGGSGLSLSDDTGYGLNVVRNTGLANSSEPVIEQGIPIAGNACPGAACRGRRRFYLTPSEHTGQTAPFACTNGFHMASLPELLASDSLSYDTGLGVSGEDTGSGTPRGFSFAGWARSGVDTSSLACDAFTSNSGQGPLVYLSVEETVEIPGLMQIEPVWTFIDGTCSNPSKVWCVED